MSTPTKSKAAADKLTEEEMLVLLLAANGGSAPGKKAYEVMVKLDKKGHSIHTFGNYYKALAIKAKALIAEFPDVELVDGAAATPKKGGPRKRKAANVDEAGDGGDGGDGIAEGETKKKAKTTAKPKGAAKKGAKQPVEEEEDVVKEEEADLEGYGEMEFIQEE